MTVTVRRNDLLEACMAAREVALDHFHLHGSQGALTLSAYSAETSLRLTLPAITPPSTPSWRCGVDAGRFQSAVRELAEDEATLTFTADTFTLSGLRSHFRFPALASVPPQNLPLLTGGGISLPSLLLKDTLARVACCASDKAERYTFNGVSFLAQNDTLRLAATDGHHLAVATLSCHTPTPIDQLVPARICDLCARAIRKDPSSQAELHFVGNNVAVRTSRFTLTARLLCGRLPSFDTLLTPPPYSARLPLAEFTALLRRAAVVIDSGKDSSTSRGVLLSFSQGLLTASAEGKGSSSCRTVAHYDGPEVSLLIKPEYPQEALSRLPADGEINLSFTDADHPLTVRQVGDEGYVYLVMAMESVKPKEADPRGVYATNF